ncbi:hypothetical protein GCM10020367_67080 [Streptomyces sannanensis]|uniref:Uncharacterized protein n=1 Tax=Streptomyces sannanensis TaxID=285536 RepID=A0ABP6S3W9_9ACTN
MSTRTVAVTAVLAGAATLAATGITYASAPQAPAALPRQAAPAPAPAPAPFGGDSGNREKGAGGDSYDREEGGRGREGGGRDRREGRRGRGEGRIEVNERTYSARPDGCITVVSGLGSTSFNVRNDSWKTVEFFRGVTCGNGAPIATIGPHGFSAGIAPGSVDGTVHVDNGVVGSFRVFEEFDHDGFDHGEFDDDEY